MKKRFIKLYFEVMALGELTERARILYALIQDRYELSLKNREGWTDATGRYCYLPRDEAMRLLKRSRPVIIESFKELVDNKYIIEKRQGQGKPNKIYLTHALSNTNYPDETAAALEESQNNNAGEKINVADEKNNAVNDEKIQTYKKLLPPNLLSEKELTKLINLSYELGRSLEEKILVLLNSKSDIKNVYGFLLKALKEDYKLNSYKNPTQNRINRFFNFTQPDYDFDELEKWALERTQKWLEEDLSKEQNTK